MKTSPSLARLLGTLLCALGSAACTSDEAELCGRLEECELFEPGYDTQACERDAPRALSSERLADCAECVSNEPCETLVDTCREFCKP